MTRPVVALETTLVAHGFPAPAGIEVALASEAAVRSAGALPATIGVLDGRVVVGLTASELERYTPEARKLGPRDLAPCAVHGAVGATTVGGTLAVAAVVGIRFMGTGGLGGVHRGFPTPPDVSADLGVCARVPALIASSGVKSLLDVPGALAHELVDAIAERHHGHDRQNRKGEPLLPRRQRAVGAGKIEQTDQPGRNTEKNQVELRVDEEQFDGEQSDTEDDPGPPRHSRPPARAATRLASHFNRSQSRVLRRSPAGGSLLAPHRHPGTRT